MLDARTSALREHRHNFADVIRLMISMERHDFTSAVKRDMRFRLRLNGLSEVILHVQTLTQQQNGRARRQYTTARS